jgi:hypothetical protein
VEARVAIRKIVVAIVLCLLFSAVASAQTTTINFATYPNGTQVPSTDVSSGNFSPTSVMADQFSSLGVHFNSTGILHEILGVTDGASTNPDGWCPTGGYNCGNNLLLMNSGPTGGQTFDTLKITFDVPQNAVQMDIDNGYLCESPSTPVTLKGVVINGGITSPVSLTLTQTNEISACSNSQSGNQLCGRFQLSAGAGKGFTEIDVAPTTCAGAASACTVTSGTGGLGPNPNCGGSSVDNLSFNLHPLAPVAAMNASPSVPVCAGNLVTLDGSASYDPQGGELTYAFSEYSNRVAPQSGPNATYTFTAPDLGTTGGTLSFNLTVADSFGLSSSLQEQNPPQAVNITVKHDNQAPIAQALEVVSQTSSVQVRYGGTVTLDGSKSYDPDGDAIAYSWVQTSGPAVTLGNPHAAQPVFTAPSVDSTLTFALTVTDMPTFVECGGALSSAAATVTVIVSATGGPPLVSAGVSQTVPELSAGSLNGSAGSPSGDSLALSWTQTAGSPVTLSGANTLTPSFTAPTQPGTLTFQLTAKDLTSGLTASSTVDIHVYDPFAPPDCSHAAASLSSLWPPDHRLASALSIIGVKDNAPSNSISMSINSIAQDEPTSGLGSGDTAPDAKINPDGTFFLRAERSGAGDGRVYHIAFTASDGYGGSCTGVATVCVPHDKGQGSTCVDQGSLYDSTH